MEEAFSRVERSTERSSHHLDDIHALLNKITLGMGGPLLRGIEYITNSHGVWKRRLDDIGLLFTQNAEDLAALSASANEHQRNVLVLRNLMLTASSSEIATLQQMLTEEENIARYMRQRVSTSEVFLKNSRLTVQSIVFLAAGFLRASYAVAAYNKALIEANNLEGNRYSLMHQSSVVAGKLGISLQEATSNARSLVNYGFDLESNFSDVLEVSTKINEAIDLSVESFARVVVLSETLNSNYKAVADTLTDIVHKTALSASEAESLVSTIMDAQLNLGKLTSPDSGVHDLVGRLEGASKSVLGVQGDLSKLLANMSTQAGMTQASILGVDPDFLLKSSGVEKVIENLRRFIEDNLGDSVGRERAARLEMISSLLGIEKKVISNFDSIYDKFTKSAGKVTDLDKARNEQVKEFYTALGKITNSFMSLVARGFDPLVRVITPIIDKLARFIEYLSNSKVAITAMSGALAVAIFLAITGIAKLTASLIALSLSPSASSLSMFGSTGFFAKFLSKIGLGASALAPFFARFGPMFVTLTGKIGVVAAKIGSLVATLSPYVLGPMIAFAVGYGIGTLLDKLFPFLGKGIEKIANVVYKIMYPESKNQYIAKGESSNIELNDVIDSFEMMILRGESIDRAVDFFNRNLANVRQIVNSANNYADRADKTAKSVAEMVEERLQKIQEIQASRELSFDKRHEKQLEVLVSLSRDLPVIMNRVVDVIQELNKVHKESQKIQEKEVERKKVENRSAVLGNINGIGNYGRAY